MEDVRKPFLELRDQNISIEWWPVLYPVPHMHKDIEILYCRKGHSLCYADNVFYEMNEGDIFISFPNQVHYYINYEIGEYAVLIFRTDIIHNIKNLFFDSVPEKNVISIEDRELIDDIMTKITRTSGAFKETIQVGLINQLTAICLSNEKFKPRSRADSSSANLQKILNYCALNYTNEISLVSVAENLHFSKYYISHLLNEKLNISFKNYINHLRVNKAIDLMMKGEKNMTRIAEKSGFSSIRTFNRVFLQLTTYTPKEYYKKIIEPDLMVREYTPL